MTEVLAFIVIAAISGGASLAHGIPLIAEAASIAMTVASVFSGPFHHLGQLQEIVV